MSHIRLENVSKIFDATPSEANTVLSLLEQGMSSAEVREKTGHSVVLYNVDLSIETGELHCIMGLSGSGKSTLIRHINRLIDPTQGKIWIDCDSKQTQIGDNTNKTINNDFIHSDNVEFLAPNEATTSRSIINVLTLNDPQLQSFRQNNVSMVFQHFGLVPHMTVIQNVAYGLRVRKVPKAERHEIARHWLNEVGLEGVESSYPDELSGGMQQRLAIGQALTAKPRILLLDEPFGALDPGTRLSMHEFLTELRDEAPMTVFMVTHDLEEGFKLGDRVLVFDKPRWDPHDPGAFGATITYDFDARAGGIPFQDILDRHPSLADAG